jgi:hypothetical protein
VPSSFRISQMTPAGASPRGNVEVEVASERFEPLAGQCSETASAPGSLALSIPAFGYVVCAARAGE